MGHKVAGSRSRAARKAGESWSRRSVRNQYTTRGFPIVGLQRCNLGLTDLNKNKYSLSRPWEFHFLKTLSEALLLLSEGSFEPSEVHDVRTPATRKFLLRKLRLAHGYGGER